MSKCNLCDKHCNKKTTSFDQCAARIRTQYQHFCNEYLRLFCHKHEFDFDEATAAWWLQGCPRMTGEEIEKLRALRGNVEQARELLMEEVKEYKEKYNV